MSVLLYNILVWILPFGTKRRELIEVVGLKSTDKGTRAKNPGQNM